MGSTGAEGLPTAGLGTLTFALVTGAGFAAFVGSGTDTFTSGRRRAAFSALALPGLGYWAPGAAVFGTGAVFTAAFAGAATGFFLETCASSMSLAVSVPSRRAEMATAGEAVDSATATAAAAAAALETSRSSLTAEHTTVRLVLTRLACDGRVGMASASGVGTKDRSHQMLRRSGRRFCCPIGRRVRSEGRRTLATALGATRTNAD